MQQAEGCLEESFIERRTEVAALPFSRRTLVLSSAGKAAIDPLIARRRGECDDSAMHLNISSSPHTGYWGPIVGRSVRSPAARARCFVFRRSLRARARTPCAGCPPVISGQRRGPLGGPRSPGYRSEARALVPTAHILARVHLTYAMLSLHALRCLISIQVLFMFQMATIMSPNLSACSVSFHKCFFRSGAPPRAGRFEEVEMLNLSTKSHKDASRPDLWLGKGFGSST